MTYKAVDLQSYEAVEDAVDETVKEIGTIDILINNVSDRPMLYKPSISELKPVLNKNNRLDSLSVHRLHSQTSKCLIL